jgi:ABC-type antimicrobial peptide transport system permease subunit
MIPAVRTALQEFRPSGAAPPGITVVDTVYRQITADRRFAAWLMTIFGALALVIGAAGIYSVMSSIVAQRTQEIGIRTVLGATPTRIVSLVLSDAGRHVVVGLAIGLAAAWTVSGIFTSLVFGVTPTEPALYLIVVGVLAVVAVAAALIPARRAARVDPIVALRE